MAITRAQQIRQLRRQGGIMGSNGGSMLVTPTRDGSRPGYYGPDAGFGDDDYQTSAVDYGGVEGISDAGARRALADDRNTLQQGLDNAAKYREDADKRRKEKEKADAERRRRERKESRKEQREARRKETKKEKRLRQMRQKAFERFQQLEENKYVDPFGDETTFANMSGEDAARLAGYNVNEFGPSGSIEYEYDKSRFRDPVTGKIKGDLTEMVDGVEQFKADAIPGYDFSINPVKSNFKSGLGTLTSTGSTTKVRPNDYGLQIPTKFPSTLTAISDLIRPETGLQAFNTLEEARNIGDLTGRYAGGDESAYDDYKELIDRTNPTIGGGGGDQERDPCKGPNPPAYCAVNNTTDPADPKQILSTRILGSQFDPTFFAAEGGRAGLAEGGGPVGGIMDLESGRQMYFLGKLVKKAKRAVKKIVKSPFGKAALMYGLGAMGGSFGSTGNFFSKGMFNPGNIGRGLFGITAKGQAARGLPELAAKKGLFGKLGLTEGYGGLMPTLKGGLALTSLLPFLGGEEDDFDIDAYYASHKANPHTTKRQMGSEFDFYKYNLAEGGMPSKEPVAEKTMPLLDMDGMEKDYREDGGFVPIGRMERADDVPARLSKNEFVFTADAVRNAGEGDIDKGAEVMYNMMKNLESGGEVSEESQGLDGAREMFETSKRLGEVL